MKWIGISGTWRTTSADVENNVRATVREIVARGDGVVAGGASGVDFFATDEALKFAPDASSVKVIIPSLFDDYIRHLEDWASGRDTGDPPIDRKEADRLIAQLNYVRETNPQALIEGPAIKADDIDQKVYYERNSVVVSFSDELVAFQINKSAGTQDTIDKTRAAGKSVTVYAYETRNDCIYTAPASSKPSHPTKKNF